MASAQDAGEGKLCFREFGDHDVPRGRWSVVILKGTLTKDFPLP